MENMTVDRWIIYCYYRIRFFISQTKDNMTKKYKSKSLVFQIKEIQENKNN